VGSGFGATASQRVWYKTGLTSFVGGCETSGRKRADVLAAAINKDGGAARHTHKTGFAFFFSFGLLSPSPSSRGDGNRFGAQTPIRRLIRQTPNLFSEGVRGRALPAKGALAGHRRLSPPPPCPYLSGAFAPELHIIGPTAMLHRLRVEQPAVLARSKGCENSHGEGQAGVHRRTSDCNPYEVLRGDSIMATTCLSSRESRLAIVQHGRWQAGDHGISRRLTYHGRAATTRPPGAPPRPRWAWWGPANSGGGGARQTVVPAQSARPKLDPWGCAGGGARAIGPRPCPGRWSELVVVFAIPALGIAVLTDGHSRIGRMESPARTV
jgi:hypothetical protein